MIPYGLTSIGEGAFKNNKNLKSIFIYSTLQAIGNQAFENCEELTRVSNSAFDTCCNIKSIGDSAFEGCSSLTSIMISDNAKSIGREAFYNCDSLTTMVIPYSVTSIGYDAFHKCNKDFTIKGYYDSFAEKYARDNNINFKSIPIETLKNNSIINSQVITLGNKIIIKGQGAGGIAPYRYSYYYKNAKDKSWVKIKDYSTAETIEFTPKVAGNYYIGVGVKDQSGKVVNKTIKLVVKPQALKNTSVVNSVSVKLGNSIKIKGAGSGGTAPYKYCYLYKTSKDKSWTKLKDYSTTQIVEFTPKTSGEYYVGISVKDNNANIVNKTIKITVYK